MRENQLDVIVDNLPVKALVDSGASSTVVSEKLCHHLKKFVVLPECSCDVILGWNFLQASGALIDLVRSQLTLDDAEAAPEKEFAKPLRPCAMTHYKIPAYSIMKISVQNPGSEGTVDMIVNGS
ncbi:hypothetical protein AVEN_155248-1 [Araneus ventricosus]|uniref:Peptidase A2 domain-containing protein n=1 Tax=Araneus ventricosus TaxID=182803 RepID=A0A4Y2D693_ARAVE|nr:hypothetical protein AVEN_155248-1 [Araneus ventricosus]